MNSSNIFVSGMIIMVLWNFLYALVIPDHLINLTIGFITTFLIAGLGTIAITGVQVAGSGLSETSVRVIAGSAIMIGALFGINVLGFQVGLGLGSNMISSFLPVQTPIDTIGFLLGTFLSAITLLAGVNMLFAGGE